MSTVNENIRHFIATVSGASDDPNASIGDQIRFEHCLIKTLSTDGDNRVSVKEMIDFIREDYAYFAQKYPNIVPTMNTLLGELSLQPMTDCIYSFDPDNPAFGGPWLDEGEGSPREFTVRA